MNPTDRVRRIETQIAIQLRSLADTYGAIIANIRAGGGSAHEAEQLTILAHSVAQLVNELARLSNKYGVRPNGDILQKAFRAALSDDLQPYHT